MKKEVQADFYRIRGTDNNESLGVPFFYNYFKKVNVFKSRSRGKVSKKYNSDYLLVGSQTKPNSNLFPPDQFADEVVAK